MEGMEHVRGRKRGHARAMGAPPAVEQHAPFSAERAVQVGPLELDAHDAVGNRGVTDAEMRDMALPQGGTILRPCGPELRVRTVNVRFE